MLPSISQVHYMPHTEQIRKATEEEKSNLSAAAHLRKDAICDVMRPGRNEAISLSMV